MSRPPIDTHLLMHALEDSAAESTYVLDRATGQVLLITPAAMTLTEEEDALTQVHSDPERYVFIEPIPSRESYGIMKDFVDGLPASDAKDQLAGALGRDRPFRRFKDHLHEHPEVREKWHQYHQHRMLAIVEKWLQDEGIEQALQPVVRQA